MAYDVNISNSKQFVLNDTKYAVAMVPDEEWGYALGLFQSTAAGWNCIPPMIQTFVDNDAVLAKGSVSGYINSMLPAINDRIKLLLAVKKPDVTNKPACVGYDFSLDLDFDKDNLAVKLNKQPPLSHTK